MENDLYVQINDTFDEIKRLGNKPSITQIAKRLGTSEERVRRTLITEGKWQSRTSSEILHLFQEKYTVSEIAAALCISEKNVQSYLPYSRGMYGGDQTSEAERCEQYRARMKSVEEKMNNTERKTDEMKEVKRPATFLEYEARKGNQEAVEAVRKWYRELETIKSDTNQTWENMKSANKDDCIQLAEKNREFANERKGVYQLRLELSTNPIYGDRDILGMNETEWPEFLKLANAKEGIIRTILVPGDMHLHALHYLIQRLFGWQNSHLHRFGLTEGDFQRVTAGRLGGWMDLCGILFRMDSEDFGDIYWDDDYRQGQSVKNWFRRKYLPPYRSQAVTDTFLYNLNRSREFESDLSDANQEMTPFTRDDLIEEYVRRMHPEFEMNTLLQRIPIKDLFIEETTSVTDLFSERLDLWHALETGERCITIDKWNLDTRKNKSLREQLTRQLKNLLVLRENRNHCEQSIHYGSQQWISEQTRMSPEEYIQMANQEIDRIVATELPLAQKYLPKVYPLFSSIMYNYDYGDDWFVKITCEKVYLQKNDTPPYDFYGYPVNEHISDHIIYVDSHGEISPELTDRLKRISESAKPECIALDGLMVLDDVGGTYGFYQMLQTISGMNPESDPEERRSMKQWARGQGWTGKMPVKDNIL